MNVFFGDIHCHSCFSRDNKARDKMERTPGEILSYARDRALLDFAAVTDHHTPYIKSVLNVSEMEWEQTIREVEEIHSPGTFLAFAGFEFSCPRGDTVIILSDNEHDYFSKGAKSIQEVWKHYQGHDILTIPHFHSKGNLAVGKWIKGEPEVEPVMEIFSCHGRFEYMDNREYFPYHCGIRKDRNMRFFLQNGYEYGIIASSDGHKGNPGFCGLIAVHAKKLTTKDIFEAIRKRRCYGLTGGRIYLDFSINNSVMGAKINCPDNKVKLDYEITAISKISKIDFLWNGSSFLYFEPMVEKIKESKIIKPPTKYGVFSLRIICENQEMAWSSPIWINT